MKSKILRPTSTGIVIAVMVFFVTILTQTMDASDSIRQIRQKDARTIRTAMHNQFTTSSHYNNW
jgi:hypothetical protein